MYYIARVTQAVAQLENIFKPRRMARIQQRLKDKGMRTGFTCFFSWTAREWKKFGKRTESATSSVDKAENAMQNILLQQMEDFDGILIATTNLTGALDPAFERRFLYKIKFDEPTSEERQHIWTSMIDGMSKKQAKELSERYNFTGGQIENISRKRLINVIITGHDNLDMQSIIESCENELLNKKQTRRIGFN